MSDLLADGDGHTALTEEEQDGLRLFYITTRGELNEAESANIARARRAVPPSLEGFLDDQHLRALHASMFGEVWAWAGRYRTTERNIGVAPWRISTEVRNLIEDLRVWTQAEQDLDALAARFHHRLVEIHPFPNGNGRHARLATEQLQTALGRPRFTWGRTLGIDTASLRARYIAALREADRTRDVSLLVEFARS